MSKKIILILSTIAIVLNVLFAIPGVSTPTSYFVVKYTPNSKELAIIHDVYSSLGSIIKYITIQNILMYILMLVLYLVMAREIKSLQCRIESSEAREGHAEKTK